MRKPGVASRASFEDMEEGMPVLSDPKQEEQDSQIQVCISPSSVDTSCSRAHSQDDWISTMLKSGVAPLASLEDLEEEVPMLPDPNLGEQKMEHYLSSASIYESASELNSQDDRYQHPSEAVDENILTRDQGAQAEAQQSVDHSATNGKDRFISTLNMLKELIEKRKGEKERYLFLFRNTPGYKPDHELMVEILKVLIEVTEKLSTAVDEDLIDEEKLKFMNETWDKMSPSDKMRMRTILHVVLNQIQRAIMTNWGLEEDLKPVAHVREIVQKLLVFVRTTRSDHEYILDLQRKVSNHTWRLNHLDEYEKRFYYLLIELVELNIVLLSSLIEQMVVLWPSLEYYAQGRGSSPVLLSRGNSDVGFQTLTNVYKSPSLWESWSIKWLHLALEEMQLDQKEWADIISRRLRAHYGGDSTDMGTEAIGSILENALETTSCLIGLGTDPGKICQDDGDKTWSMFCIEYLDEEKFRDTDDLELIRDIKQLVSINRLLLRLRWSLDKLIEDYVRASKGEEDAEHDQDICAWYFVYEDRYIFEEENAKPFGTSLTMDDIPYADDAVGVTECNAAVEVFLDKFLRQIRSINDNSLLQHGDAGIMLKNLRDHALSMEQERMKSLADIKRENLPALKSRLIAAYGANSPGDCSWRRRLMMPTDALLFPIEREALRKIVSSPECNVIENMDKVAAPNRSYRRRNVEDDILNKAIKSFNTSEIPEPRAQGKDVFLLMLFLFLYLLDVISDCYVAYKHCSEANYLYFGLTLVFIFGPMLADLIGNMYHKWSGELDTWKEIFDLQSLKLLPRAIRSVWYAVDSRREFDPDQTVLYEELNRLRVDYLKIKEEKIRQSEKSWINGLSFAAMVENEREQLHWKLHEALNESAPQLLLQLVIVLMQLGNGETVGLLTYIGILTSLASFAWSLHLYHYMLHYDGLVNNLKWFHRLTDFLAHFLIVGCRFIALSMVMALYPLWFSVAAFFYLGFLFLYLYFCSSRQKSYRWLTTQTTNTLWMVYRLFITPYRLIIWRMDSYDDLVFHLETFALALSWPFLMDGGHPLAHYRWNITATIFILNFIVLPLLLKLNERMFEESPNCFKDHDPFPIRSKLWNDLKAGKTRMERLFGRNTSTSTST